MRHEELFWARRAVEGDSNAFGLLASRYLPNVKKWIGSRVTLDNIDDLSQETLLRAFRSIENLREPELFPQWLRGISLNVVRMHFRTNSNTQLLVLDEQLEPGIPNNDHSSNYPTEQHMIEELRSKEITNALLGLSAAQREALSLRYLDGMSYAQIAKTLGVSVAAVKSRMHRGRIRAKEHLLALESLNMEEQDRTNKSRIHEVFLAELSGEDPLAVVVLKPDDQDVFVAIWVPKDEGQAILMSLRGDSAPRPLTHNLMGDLLEATGVKVERVVITELGENDVFYGEVRVRGRNGAVDVDARPSDAIALALLSGSDLFVSQSVLEAVGREEISPETLSRNPRVSITPLELPDFDEWVRKPGEEGSQL